jgi:hypothetical protein
VIHQSQSAMAKSIRATYSNFLSSGVKRLKKLSFFNRLTSPTIGNQNGGYIAATHRQCQALPSLCLSNAWQNVFFRASAGLVGRAPASNTKKRRAVQGAWQF